MDWKKLIADIQSSGLTQTEIGKQVGVVQSTISELASGKLTDPRDSIGCRLRRLHRQRIRIARTQPDQAKAEGASHG